MNPEACVTGFICNRKKLANQYCYINNFLLVGHPLVLLLKLGFGVNLSLHC